MREWLLESFKYDHWANRIWADWLAIVADERLLELGNRQAALPDFPEGPARANEVFCHSVWANAVWLRRIGEDILFEGYDPAQWLETILAGWMRVFQTRDLDERIEYCNFRGEPGNLSISEIARHVMDHGAYHRGQLREICDGRDFPQPSPVGYFMSLHA